MITGQGTTFIQPNVAVPPPVFPPFPANSAENGLSVDPITGAIVLGNDVGAPGDPAQFLNDRELTLRGFDLTLFGNTNLDPFPILRFNTDPINPTGNIGSVQTSGNNGSNISWQGGDPLGASPIIRLESFTTNTVLTFGLTDDETTTAEIFGQFDDGVNGNQVGLFLDFFNQLFQIGDTNDIFNGNKLSIDDAGQRWEIGQRTAITNLLLNFPSAGIGLSFFDSNGTNPFLLPDPGIGGIAFMSAPDFSTQLSLSDAGSGSIGQIGDIGAASTGMVMQVNVPGSRVDILNTGLNAIVNINGVNGFTGVVAPVNTITVDGGIVTNVA